MLNLLAMAAALAGTTVVGAENDVLVAGRDVPAPERTQSAEPEYPAIAQLGHVTGVVLLDIVVDATGRPKAIGVLRRVPPLDRAALECARKWRFAQTLVDGKAREVRLVAAVEFFGDQKDASRGYREIAENKKESSLARVFAVQRLGTLAVGGKQKDVMRLLEKLRQDSVTDVARAAEAALASLSQQ